MLLFFFPSSFLTVFFSLYKRKTSGTSIRREQKDNPRALTFELNINNSISIPDKQVGRGEQREEKRGHGNPISQFPLPLTTFHCGRHPLARERRGSFPPSLPAYSAASWATSRQPGRSEFPDLDGGNSNYAIHCVWVTSALEMGAGASC